jgi:hypothetical protein
MTLPSFAIRVLPANQASWDDLQTVFGTRGAAFGCQCQRYKLRAREAFRNFPVEERAHRLRRQTACGHPESGRTSGLLAYLDAEPVGWCGVQPRTARPAYPITTKDVITEELHVGTEGVFTQAGFAQVSRPILRRVVMRIDF